MRYSSRRRRPNVAEVERAVAGATVPLARWPRRVALIGPFESLNVVGTVPPCVFVKLFSINLAAAPASHIGPFVSFFYIFYSYSLLLFFKEPLCFAIIVKSAADTFIVNFLNAALSSEFKYYNNNNFKIHILHILLVINFIYNILELCFYL